MSSRAAGTEDAGPTAANHQGRDQAIDRKPSAENAIRLLTQPSHNLLQRSTIDLNSASNALKASFLQSTMKAGSSLPASVMLGANQSGSTTFNRPSVPILSQTTLVPRITVPVSAAKSDVASIVTLTQPASMGAISSPVYRQTAAAVAAVNLSQKLHPASNASSVHQQHHGPGNLSFGLSAALVRPNVTSTSTVGLSVIRPVTGVAPDAATLARMMPVTSLIRAPSGQIPLQMPVTGPTRVVNQAVRIPAPAAGPSDLKAAAQSQAHSHVHRAPQAAAIVLSQPRSGGTIAIAKPAHLSGVSATVVPSAAIGIPTAIGIPVLSATNIGSSVSATPLGTVPNRSLSTPIQRPQSAALSLIPTQRPNLGTVPTWTLQSQPSLVVTATNSSSMAMQSSKGHDFPSGAMQLAARPLAFAQPIRPQQVALVATQKTLGSPVATTVVASRIPEGSIVVGPINSRSASVINVAHPHVGNAAGMGQAQAINLTQNAHKPQTIVLANANSLQLPRQGSVQTSVSIGGLQKAAGQATALNLTQHGRQQKNLKPQPSGGMSPGSLLPSTYNTPLALTTSKSGGVAALSGGSVTSVANVGAKTVTVIPGQSVHQLSVADGLVNRVVTTGITSHASSSISAPHAPTTIRLANPTPNAVLLGAYGIPTAPVTHTGASSLPLTLQPLMPTVDPRHTGDRTAFSQTFVGCYATNVMTYGNVPRLTAAGSGVPAGSFAIGMLSSGSIIVSTAPATASASVPMARVNNVSSAVSMSSAHPVHPTVNSQYPAVIDATNRLMMAEGSSQSSQTLVALTKLPASRQSSVAVSESAQAGAQTVMSPRPGILRKRGHEPTQRVTAKRNLEGALGTSSSLVSCASSADSSLLPTSPKSLDGSRENSRSSTDTASSVESSPPTASSGSHHHRIARELCHDRESDRGDRLESVSASDSGFRSIPRKKPRKQSLRANEEIHPGFSSDDETEECASDWLPLSSALVQDSLASSRRDSPLPPEYRDKDGVRYTLEPQTSPSNNISILGSYHCSWKPRSNHFNSHADFKAKEDRRPSVNELANQKGVAQRASGWKIHMLASELESLATVENTVLDEVLSIHTSMSLKKSSTRQSLRGDDTTRIVSELIQGNIQRCRHYVDQLSEAKSALLHIVEERRPRAMDIISRHQSKRAVKKKERL